jgi:TPR repeat protein
MPLCLAVVSLVEASEMSPSRKFSPVTTPDWRSTETRPRPDATIHNPALGEYDNFAAKMTLRIMLLLALMGPQLNAQDLGQRSLPLPKDDSQFQIAPGSAPAVKADPAQQVAECRALADKGDVDAAFQMGLTYLLGQTVSQDSATAEQYFKKAEMTPSRMCFVAETYMETALPGRIEAAKRWAVASNSGCGYWSQAQWYGSNRLGPDPAKEIEYLKQGLAARDSDFRGVIAYRLGELILTGTAVNSSPTERVAWVGTAARLRLGQTEMMISYAYSKHPEEEETPETALLWTGHAARYGVPNALATLGQAARTREATHLTYLDGMALYVLGMRQNLLSSVGLDAEMKQLQPEQREDLLNAIAAWERIERETGGYYSKTDALRLSAPVDMNALMHTATTQNPDARLRLAYVYKSMGELSKAEALYRDVWQNGSARLWLQLGDTASKAGKWAWARELYGHAANVGSRSACLALARIDGEGLSGKKDAFTSYLWLLRAEIEDAQLLARRRNALSKDELKAVELTQAEWVLAHKEYWQRDVKPAQAIVDAQQRTMQPAFSFAPRQPVATPEQLQSKADAGDLDAAYLFAVTLLSTKDEPPPAIALIERYAAKGAITPEQKAHIAYGYSGAAFLDEPTRRKYIEKWWVAVGGSRCYYELGKLYNGKSDGIVETVDEKKAVAHWQRAVEEKDERWARLARMELGYRVVKGWSSGDKAHDAAWAHELAMEFIGKELYSIAGEYSYGRELAHSPEIFLRFSERAAIYNIDNAQNQLAQAIIEGNWKQRDDADAYAWMKLRAVKQGDDKQVEIAEQNPELKERIEARYNLLQSAQASSGAYYPQDDPMRTAEAEDLEPRASQRDPEAQIRLGSLLEEQGTDASLTRAIALYRQLWATAAQEVKLTWGRSLMYGGRGVARDDVGVEKWLWDAADAGSHEACRLLAVIYGEGRGVKADPIAAEAWIRLSNLSTQQERALTSEDARAVAARIADWKAKHPAW